MWAFVITLHLSLSSSPSVNFSYFYLLLWNHWTDLVQIGNPTWLPGPIMCSDWLKLWKSSCQKLLSRWNCNINDDWVVLYQVCYFCADRKSKMAATGRLSLTLDPIALFECSLDGPIPDLLFWSRSEIARANNVLWLVETLKIFLSETTPPMEL